MLLILAFLLMLEASNQSMSGNPRATYLDEITSVREKDITYLGFDKDSGCYCRIISIKIVACLGEKSCVRLSGSAYSFMECQGASTCTKIPKPLNVQEKNMSIHNTNIEKLQQGDFKHYSHLTQLAIEQNPKLDEFQDNCFEGLVNLRNLTISSNSYNTLLLTNKTFHGLNNLGEMWLINNGLTSIHNVAYAISPNILPNLNKLVLDQNNFEYIDKNDLLPLVGSPLQQLILITCHINNIHENAFDMLKNLAVLKIVLNPIEYRDMINLLKSMQNNSIPLQKLHLFKVGLTKPPKELMEVIRNSTVTEMCFGGNHFSIIKDNFFIPMQNIKILYIEEVLAFEVAQHTFSVFENLTELHMKNNRISNITNRVQLQHLELLDVSFNTLNLEDNSFGRLLNLRELNLARNKISFLSSKVFSGLNKLEYLNLEGNVITLIEDDVFAHLAKLKFLSLQGNSFHESLTNKTFVGLQKLEYLLMGGCGLLQLHTGVFESMPLLKFLGLEKNSLVQLSPDLFKPLRALTDINLNSNQLLGWDEQLFSHNNSMECLHATQNFKTITYAMIKDFSNMRYIDVKSDLLECDDKLAVSIRKATVENNNTLEWFGMPKHKIPSCAATTLYKNMSILDYYLNVNSGDFEHNTSVLQTVLAIIFVACFVLILFVIYYKYRWHISYWVLLKKIAIIRRCKRKHGKVNPTAKQEYEFDAFVSYSNEDRNFVVMLVDMLENHAPFLKLCVYERDFQVGGVISESVLENVGKSRKTLLVVSNAYTKSQWCRWEVQVAENFRLFFQNENGIIANDSIVVIKLEEVEKANMSPMLKYLLKTRIYLPWETEKCKQKEFWKKLRSAIAPLCAKDMTV